MKNHRTNALTHQRTGFMKRCIALALKGYGQTSPNPLVGAVVVKKGKIIAEGYHKKAGSPHAEINALKAAGKKASGADLYVNLEPCCHFGRTPPCTDKIIKSGIKRVFFGMKDPNPKVSGNGIRTLKKAGIKVVGPLLPNLCKKLNEPFVKWMSTGFPYVTLKIATTLDGKIADKFGKSKWISNEKTRLYAHWLRAGHDIVMVGSETARRDKPRLNVRLPGYAGKQPLPMVIASKKGKKIHLKKLFHNLGAAGFQSIMVEGGGLLHTELLKNGLVDYIVIVIAPKIFGCDAKPWIHNLGNLSAKRPFQLSIERTFQLGDNIVLEGRPA